MRLKKKPKIILITVSTLVVLGLLGVVVFKALSKDQVKEVKIENTIKKYNYNLKENKPKKYKEMFSELKKILSEDKVDEEKYVNQIARMFVYDFFSLNDKTAKTDVGGVEFVLDYTTDNFLENAENTYYKYVESNIYNNRKQKLPIVDDVTVESTENITFEYGETSDEKAYQVKVKWSYTDDSFSDYQNEAVLTFVHDDFKLCLVQLTEK